jgi:hypothetical protein
MICGGFTGEIPLLPIAKMLCCPCCRAAASSWSLDAPPPPWDAPPSDVHYSSWLPLVCWLVVMSHLFTTPPPCVTFCLAAASRVHLQPPTFIRTGWLLHRISSRCLRLPSSRQHHRLLMPRHLMLPRRLHLLFTSCLPRLVAVLPLVAPPPHIHQLALPSAFASCFVLFSSAPANCCVVSHHHVTLLPYSIASPAHSWLLRLLSAPLSLITVAWPLLTLRHCPLFHLSHASSLAACCVAFTHAAASDLPASPPLITPPPLVVPWPPVPLVGLVVALLLLPLPPPICWRLRLSLHRHLSSHHGLPCLLSCWLSCCLHCSSSRHIPASQHATSTSNLLFAFCLLRLVVELLLVALPLPPILLTRNHLSMHRLIVIMPLVALPLQLVHLAHCCLLMCRLHLQLPFASCLSWLVVASLFLCRTSQEGKKIKLSVCVYVCVCVCLCV